MLLKSADSKDDHIAELERQLKATPEKGRDRIIQELRKRRAGIKNEEDAAFQIDFYYKGNDNYIVLHDLRIEVGDRSAQIDHLLINRCLDCFVLESKHFHSGIEITETGEFLARNDYKDKSTGIESPLAQNERHIAVLKEAFAELKMPTRLGIRLSPTFHSYVLVSTNATIARPKNFDTSRVIKVDMLKQAIEAQFDKESTLDMVKSMAKAIDVGALVTIGRQLMALHKPIQPNLAAKFGIVPQASPPALSKAKPTEGGPACKECAGEKGAILYGKYGYYFKCAQCQANTAIRLECRAGHKERLRKDGPTFSRECEECRSSRVYFVNPTEASSK